MDIQILFIKIIASLYQPEIRELPAGERELLHWIIYIAIGVIVILGTVVAYLHKQIMRNTKELIIHTERTNVLIADNKEAIDTLGEIHKDNTRHILDIIRGVNK